MHALQQHPSALPIQFHSHWRDKEGSSFGLSIDVYARYLEVSVSSSDLHLIAGLHERVRDIFHASNPPAERSARRTRYEAKKTVFLAHRFDDCGTSTSSCLKTFLRRLGFDVVEGSGYETRDIPDKVSEKIAAQDVFICVATPGDPTWIVSEASYAKALNKYLIVLVQENVELNKGILGQDHEYLSFPPNNIEKAFNDLLYALPS